MDTLSLLQGLFWVFHSSCSKLGCALEGKPWTQFLRLLNQLNNFRLLNHHNNFIWVGPRPPKTCWVDLYNVKWDSKQCCSAESSLPIVKFTQLCSKFPPTALLNFACDWLALDRDISLGQLTSPTCDVISLSRANHHKQSSRVLWAGICCKAGWIWL